MKNQENGKMDNYSKQSIRDGGTELEVHKFLMSNFLTSLRGCSQMRCAQL